MACASDPGADDSPIDASANQSDENTQATEIERRISARADIQTKIPDPVPQTTGEGVTGELPAELLGNIKKDLAERLSAGNASITVVIAESVTWNDGALGCPQPGGIYTQATVPGYRVVLELAGQRYTYHATADGYFEPCAAQNMMPPPGRTPTQ
jgi:hypothetical protein